RPPPFSLLFPYTTLFRSAGTAGVNLGGLKDERQLAYRCQRVHVRRGCPSRSRGRRPPPARLGADLLRPRHEGGGAGAPARGPRIDRKSTRLNSSHVKISY